jgi:Predicted transcriptional regulators
MRIHAVDVEQKEKIPAWCAGEDWCPVTGTAELLANKWHPVIIHRLLEHQELGFNSLKDEVDGVSSKVLSESLDNLRNRGIVRKEVVDRSPKRVKYSLTELGSRLEPVIEEMGKWGSNNLKKPDRYA